MSLWKCVIDFFYQVIMFFSCVKDVENVTFHIKLWIYTYVKLARPLIFDYFPPDSSLFCCGNHFQKTNEPQNLIFLIEFKYQQQLYEFLAFCMALTAKYGVVKEFSALFHQNLKLWLIFTISFNSSLCSEFASHKVYGFATFTSGLTII